jgi:hypothetical protein
LMGKITRSELRDALPSNALVLCVTVMRDDIVIRGARRFAHGRKRRQHHATPIFALEL